MRLIKCLGSPGGAVSLLEQFLLQFGNSLNFRDLLKFIDSLSIGTITILTIMRLPLSLKTIYQHGILRPGAGGTSVTSLV